MTDETPPTLYLLDGTAQFYRAHFALPPMTTSAGLPTSAVYGFTSMLRKLLNDHRPAFLGVAFDPPGRSFRAETYPAYKTNRPPMPPDLKRQGPYARRVCTVLGLRTIEQPGYEADDVIATYARLARERGFRVVVVSSDKDLMQLVGDDVRMWNPSKEMWLDEEGVAREFGVAPERVLDTQGLMGDSVDNIPGVPGVGEKTAVAMIGACGNLDGVIARAGRFVALFDARDAALAALEAAAAEDPVPGAAAAALGEALDRLTTSANAFAAVEADESLRERARRAADEAATLDARALADRPVKEATGPFRDLKRALNALDKGSQRKAWYAVHENADQARMSRALAELFAAVPGLSPLDDLAVGEPDRAAAVDLFSELEFKALIGEFRGPAVGSGAAPGVAAPAAPAADIAIETVTDRERLDGLAREIAGAGRVAVEPLCAEGGPLEAGLVGLGLAFEAGRAVYVPVGHAYLGAPRQFGGAEVAESLGPVLAGTGVRVVAADLKSSWHTLDRCGMPFAGWDGDLELAAFLLEADRTDYGLSRLAAEHASRDVPGRDDLLGSGARRLPAAEVPVDRAAEWAGRRAEAIGPLFAELRGRLEAERLAELYDTIDRPLLPVLARMERLGVRVDTARLESMALEMERSLDESRARIHRLAGVEFNVDSPKQLREVLFDRLGLAPRRKTAKSKVASTDAQTLEDLAGDHEIAAALLDYRETSKLKGTYVDALPRLVDPRSGRVHTRFQPTGAATGRLSSTDPNLQNIPVRTEAGRRIREAFVAAEGAVLLASDYSQVELRVLAHLCGDAGLAAAFRAGEDIHRYTASKVGGVMLELVTPEARRRAKAVNFGILYGMSETRLAREQGMSRTEARRFIEAYFERFASVRSYIDDVRERVMREGEVRTLFGRVRRFPQLRQRVHRGIVEQALRAAVNTTIQGTAADLMKMAMLRVESALERQGLASRMLLQVHDELLLEVPVGEIEAARALVREAMEGVYPLAVPLVVDQKTGRNWSEVA